MNTAIYITTLALTIPFFALILFIACKVWPNSRSGRTVRRYIPLITEWDAPKGDHSVDLCPACKAQSAGIKEQV